MSVPKPISQNLAGNVLKDNATADVGTRRKYDNEEIIANQFKRLLSP